MDQVQIFNHDPFIDFNGNGIVPGRPGTGMLETLGPILGISGDKHEHGAGPLPLIPAAKVNPKRTFMRAYYLAKGHGSQHSMASPSDVAAAVHEMLGSHK